MPNDEFIFKHFIIKQDKCAMKVGTDAMIFGAYVPFAGAERILDIGTGTGVLSLMMAQRTGAEIDAVEIDAMAANQAKENFGNSVWSHRLQIHCSAIQDFRPADDNKYDLIVSNPPYFEVNKQAASDSEKYRARTQSRSFERLSFDDLLMNAKRLLSDEGVFYLVIPFEATGFFTAKALKLELFPKDRLDILSKENQGPVRSILGFTHAYRKENENKFVIYNANGKYSEDYIDLTKDYHAKKLETV